MVQKQRFFFLNVFIFQNRRKGKTVLAYILIINILSFSFFASLLIWLTRNSVDWTFSFPSCFIWTSCYGSFCTSVLLITFPNSDKYDFVFDTNAYLLQYYIYIYTVWLHRGQYFHLGNRSRKEQSKTRWLLKTSTIKIKWQEGGGGKITMSFW